MYEHIKSGRIVILFLFAVVFVTIVFSSGCSALVKATARECIDDGKHAKIKNQSFARHFGDAMLEELSGIQPVIDKSKN